MHAIVSWASQARCLPVSFKFEFKTGLSAEITEQNGLYSWLFVRLTNGSSLCFLRVAISLARIKKTQYKISVPVCCCWHETLSFTRERPWTPHPTHHPTKGDFFMLLPWTTWFRWANCCCESKRGCSQTIMSHYSFPTPHSGNALFSLILLSWMLDSADK